MGTDSTRDSKQKDYRYQNRAGDHVTVAAVRRATSGGEIRRPVLWIAVPADRYTICRTPHAYCQARVILRWPARYWTGLSFKLEVTLGPEPCSQRRQDLSGPRVGRLRRCWRPRPDHRATNGVGSPCAGKGGNPARTMTSTTPARTRIILKEAGNPNRSTHFFRCNVGLGLTVKNTAIARHQGTR